MNQTIIFKIGNILFAFPQTDCTLKEDFCTLQFIKEADKITHSE